MTTEQLNKASAISKDKRKAFIQTVQEILPNASIFHDPFHLVKYLNEAIDKLRRREVKQHQELKNSRYDLLKNPEYLSERQPINFEAIADANYEISKAWQVLENFKDLFSKGNLPATLSFLQWANDATKRKIKEVEKVVKMFKDHISGVVNVFLINLTNAMAERLNGKIQEFKTTGKRYRTVFSRHDSAGSDLG